MWQFSPCLERRSVEDDFLPQVLLEVSLDHIIVLFLNHKINEDVYESFNLMSWNFEYFFDFPNIFFRKQNSSILIYILIIYHFLQLRHIC